MLRRNRHPNANSRERRLAIRCRLRVESLETRTMLSAIAMPNPMVDMGLSPFDPIADVAANDRMAMELVHESYEETAIELRNPTESGNDILFLAERSPREVPSAVNSIDKPTDLHADVLDANILPDWNINESFRTEPWEGSELSITEPGDALFFDFHGHTSDLACPVSEPLVDFFSAGPDVDITPLIGVDVLLEEANLDWAYQQPGVAVPSMAVPVNYLDPSTSEMGFRLSPNFVPEHEYLPASMHSDFSNTPDLLSTSDLLGRSSLFSKNGNGDTSIMYVFTNTVSTQFSDSAWFSEDGLFTSTSYDITSLSYSDTDLFGNAILTYSKDSTTSLISNIFQSEMILAGGTTLAISSQYYDAFVYLSMQLQEDGFATLDQDAEGGFVEIGCELGQSFQISKYRDDNPTINLTWSNHAGHSLQSSSWDFSNNDTALSDIYLDNHFDWDTRGDSSTVQTIDVAEQDASHAYDPEEGGMIAFAAGTNFTASDMSGLPADASSGMVTSISDQAIDIDNGVDVFQAFELADAPTELSSGDSLSQQAEQVDTSNQMSSTTPENEVPATDDPTTVKTESNNQKVHHAANTTTIVVASLLTVVGGWYRAESPSDRRQRQIHQLRH